MRRIRDHLTYANVMATLAVFLVLSGGTAVALNGAEHGSPTTSALALKCRPPTWLPTPSEALM